jgi:homoserine O-succinyltransferase/O-acetyltransferase
MPIKIPDSLPATSILESENIFVMTEYRAMHQDIRPLYVLVVNLMPTKIMTETQIMRKLSNTPLQIETELLRMASHESHNVSEEHMETFYTTFESVKNRHFDGMIITGAPVESLPFDEVDYWDELVTIMQWSQTNVHCTLHICWGAQAGIHYHYGVPKYPLERKLSGVYQHRLLKPSSPIVRGFDDEFNAPHSRNTTVYAADIESIPELEIIADSEEAGVYLVKSTDSRQLFVFGHPEYDHDTLAQEYFRDLNAGLDPDVPAHYFPGDDPWTEPISTWRAHAQLLYTNWLNYYVYQSTPYDIDKVGENA